MRYFTFVMFRMRKLFGFRFAATTGCLLAALSLPRASQAQQQFQGVCSQVKIVIQQQLTIERIGFEATLEVSNNDGEDPITDFYAALTFENPALSTNGVVNDASSLFFVQSPTFESVNGVSGNGVIGPTTKAVIKWFLIPKISAGGSSPDGVRYKIGCNLGGKLRGVQIPSDVMLAIPATIYVKPEPQLEITYFQPRDVQGDDPFTPEVETPVPFTIGVLVKNSGYGLAKSVKIDSQQPKIVENKQNLLLIAQLLGARVADQLVTPSSLLVNLGDIPPGQTRKGAWDMITSLSGEFVEFKASYTHASELGGLETSVIKSLNAYFISHEVMNDQAGRDTQKDFLAITDNNADLIPTALYESEGNILPVNYLTNTAVVGSASSGGSFQVTLSADKPGWCYMRMSDPGQARLPIASVVRSDGKILNTNNYWTNVRYTQVGNIRQAFLNFFDLVDLKNYSYTVTYATTVADITPPVTTLRFAGSVTQSGGKYYVTPDTQMYFTSEDASPVSIVYSLTNSPFYPALPFSLSAAGEYQLVFYATDSAGNKENNQTNVLVVSGNGALDFASLTAPSGPLFVSGDTLSVRPFNAPFALRATSDPSQVNATFEFFQGVVGWASVSNVPSSPTSDTTASLAVGGPNVDYYKYQVNGGAWSAERAVATPISLSGLAAAGYTVNVLGRSQYGGYLDASNALAVNWVVSPTAPPTRVTGAPATPTRQRTAALNIGGTGVTSYEWNINAGYYRAPSNAPSVLPLTISSAGQQNVSIWVIGKTNGVFQDTNNPTIVGWNFDPLFGYSQPSLSLVRSTTISNIGTSTQTFNWDGRDNSGVALAPGWYTARITLTDALGMTNFASRLVQIGSLSGTPVAVADTTRGPKNPYARGRWAVWQDQSSGNYEIYAQDLVSNTPVVKLTSTTLSQENARTDGRYVVWQGRQVGGNWEIYLKDLGSNTAVQQLTSASASDKVNPAIEWPWVVYQRRQTANQNAPYQLVALNLANMQSFSVWPSTQDQLDPDIQAGRVVWQDWRDVGPGEIYFKNLETGEQRRITTNTFGQYHPAIYDNWIVWQDNRNGQVDLYGYDFLRNLEVRLTSTPENETRPYLDGPWAVCLEDSLGNLSPNLRLVHVPSQRMVPITRTLTGKDRPALLSGRTVWLNVSNSLASVQVADVPSLQAVFQNRNTVTVTPAMATYQQDAFTLLSLWNAQAGVQEITHYTSLVPSVATETAVWRSGAPAGTNFTLTAGSFLWVKFADQRVLDLGMNSTGSVNLSAGANVLSYAGFPSQYSAYRLLQQLGGSNARAVRMLDAESGRWLVAEVRNGQPIGVDFAVPRVAVLMVDLANAVNNFQPQ
jgi:beta propeller repeat protein